MKGVVALCLLLGVAAALAAEGEDYVEVATNRRVLRPTRGLVRAEMVDALPAAKVAQLREAAAEAAEAAGKVSLGLHMSASVESAELHPAPTVTAHFSSAPLLSADEQEQADAMAAAGTVFTPDAVVAGGGGDVAHSSYVEVDGVQLLTEIEREAMAEQALIQAEEHARVQARAGLARKYLVHYGFSNTGTVLSRYEHQTAFECRERCSTNSACVAFTVSRLVTATSGMCTLRSAWGSNIENQGVDSYQAIDFSGRDLPLGALSVDVKCPASEQQVFVLVDVTRARPQRNQRTSEVVVTVNHNAEDSFWGLVPSHYESRGGSLGYRALSLAGATRPLPGAAGGAGAVAAVRVQYSRSAERLVEEAGDAVSGCAQHRLTAIPFPIEVDAARGRVYEVVGQQWNVAATAALASTQYVALPGAVPSGAQGAMKIKLAVAEDGARLLVFADITRVQHSNGWTNSVFRVTVDKQEIGYTNTGEHYGWQFRSVSLRAASGPLKRGEHTIEVQAKTQRGKLFLLSDGNGHQQRRLNALVVPKGNLWNKNWNLGTAWLKATSWADLPGAPMKLSLTTAQPGHLLVTVGISRVQSWGNGNVALRLLLEADGAEPKELARTNTGTINGWRYRDVSFHGTSKLLGPGAYTLRVQFQSPSGSTVVFYNDVNGYQQRRLSAVLIPPSAGLQTVTQGLCSDKKKASAAAPAPAPAAAAAPAAK